MDEGSCLFISTISVFAFESLANGSKTENCDRKSPAYEVAYSAVCTLLITELPFNGKVTMLITTSKQTAS
jgi:hypothetical protein